MGGDVTRPPAPDELEVSLFGRGVGECAVVHLGSGEWLVVDSCLDPQTEEPVALRYLRELGLAPHDVVRMLVVTHWHDDHMSGAAAIFAAAAKAKFVCSAALQRQDFRTLLATDHAASSNPSNATARTREFSAILDLLKQRNARGARVVTPEWTMQDRLLHERSGPPSAQVYALAPSSSAMTRGFRGIASAVPREGSDKLTAVDVGPNDSSVVLSVRLGQASALLGADLEHVADPAAGWNAVVGSTAAAGSRAQVFKVPHHGSENAHCDAVWSQLLVAEPHAVITPFAKGAKPLPTEADLARIRKRTPNVSLAGRASEKKVHFSDTAVERTVRETVGAIRPRQGALGHVRVRVDPSGTIRSVDYFGNARAV